MTPTAVVSKRGLDRLRAGHPWIYRSDVLSVVFEVVTIIAIWPFLNRSYADAKPARVDTVGRVVIGITIAYVIAFSSWAMLGDQGAIHKAPPTGVAPVPKTSPTPLNAGP